MVKAEMLLSSIDETDFVGFCVAKIQLGQGTIRNVRFDLRYLARWFGEKDFTKEGFEQFLLERQEEKLSHSYLNKFIHLSRYLDKYVKARGLGDFSFVWEFQSFSIARPPFEILDNLQIEALYEVKLQYGVFHGINRTDELNFLHSTVIMFLSQTGCRFSELQDLQVKHFDTHKGEVLFVETKNGEYRKNFIYDELLRRVTCLIDGKSREELVFTNSKGSKMVNQDFNQDLKMRCKETGIIPKWQEITTHTFRHSLIVELLSNGVPMAVVSSWVGHKDIQSTYYYYKSLDTHLRQAIAKHGIIRKILAPEQLLKQMVEAFESFNISDDPRFVTELTRSNTGFSLDVKLKH